ncbi:MAG: hypothetical protein NZM43_00125 [Saprospiraceae bacterium]|nr:hypothetical protein [Saprospiraceae bacterium]MDW8482707.1 hypothetical protein [Saprospiraceae bacterium]
MTGTWYTFLLILWLSVWNLGASTSSFGQNTASSRRIVVSEALPLRNDYGYEIIGRLRDRILLFRDKVDDFEVQAFDNAMRPIWSRVLDDISKDGVQILAVIGGTDKFSVIYKQRRRGSAHLRVHQYDASATRVDSATIKVYSDRVLTVPELEIYQSEDRNCIVVTNMAERGRIETTCFRLNRLEVLWDKVLLIDDTYQETNLRGMEVSNAGDLFVITEWNNRRNRLGAHEYQVTHVRADTNRLIRVPLPDFLTSDVKFVFDNLNQALVGAGLYAERNRERANGAFYVRIPLVGEPMVRYESFSDRVVSALRRKDVADDTRGISYANVRQIVLRRDGGALLVAELYHEIQRGSLAGRGIWRDGMRLVMDYYYDDLLLIALNPDGSAHWMTVLHKRQYSQDDDAIFSSFCMVRAPDRIHILFNDEIKYENTCSEYIITPLGEFDRNSLLNTYGQNLRLRFRDALQLNANECVVPSEFRNKLRLVLIKF